MQSNPARERREYLLAKSSRHIVPVRVDDVLWAGASPNGVELHLGRDVLKLHGTLAGLEASLNPDRFVRIHRSVIVNLAHVDRFVPRFAGDYTVVLVDGTELKLSRHYRRQVKQRFGIV